MNRRHTITMLAAAVGSAAAGCAPPRAAQASPIAPQANSDAPQQNSIEAHNVTDFGADATGVNDSTVAIQEAVDAVFAAGGGQVYFPPGEYKVLGSNQIIGIQVPLRGLHLYGPGAMLKVSDNAPADFARIFSNTNQGGKVLWDSDDDSPPVVVEGLLFDGNKDRTSYSNYEQEHSNAIFAWSDNRKKGRVVWTIRDCYFCNFGGVAVQSHSNSHMKMINCHVKKSFSGRGLYSCTGGNSYALVDGCTGVGESGRNDVPGIDIEINQGSGYDGEGKGRQMDLTLVNLNIDGKCDLGGGFGQLNISNCNFYNKADNKAFNILGVVGEAKATVRVTNCYFSVVHDHLTNQALGVVNRVTDIRFDNCTFEIEKAGNASQYEGLALAWKAGVDGRVVFSNCDFKAGSTVLESDKVTGVFVRRDLTNSQNDECVFSGCRFHRSLDVAIDIEGSGRNLIENCKLYAKDLAVNAPTSSRSPLYLMFRDNDISSDVGIRNRSWSDHPDTLFHLSRNQFTGTSLIDTILSGGSGAPVKHI